MFGFNSAAPAQATILDRLYLLLVMVVATAGIGMLLWLFGGVLMMIFAAALLGVVLHGAAAQLSRFTHLPHWLSLLVVVLVVCALLVALGVYAGPNMVEQAGQLRDALRNQGKALHDQLAQREWGRTVLDQVPSAIGGNKDGGIPDPSRQLAGSVFGVFNSVLGVFGTLAVVVIAALYFAAQPAPYVNGMVRLVPERHRDRASRLLRIAGQALWSWSAGQALDMLAVGLLTFGGLWLIGIPLALPLGVLAGLLNFVPYIGAIAGAVPAVFLALSVGPTAAVETLALFAVIQGFEGNVMAPMIQKHAVNMPPGLTLMAQTVVGAVLGLPGLILATPLCAALLAVLDDSCPPLNASQAIQEPGEAAHRS